MSYLVLRVPRFVIHVAAFGSTLLLLHTFACSPARADTVASNACAGRDVDYVHNTTTCKLLRRAQNQVTTTNDFCVTIPGVSSTKCDTYAGSIQDGVKTVETLAGTATIIECADGKCDSTRITTCDITYLKVKMLKQPPEQNSQQNSVVDPFDNVLIGCNCSWSGSTVAYTVVNNTNASQTVTWPATPFANVVVAAHAQATLTAPSASPGTFEYVVTVADGAGHVQTFMATTIAQPTVGLGSPLLPRWGAFLLALLLGGVAAAAHRRTVRTTAT